MLRFVIAGVILNQGADTRRTTTMESTVREIENMKEEVRQLTETVQKLADTVQILSIQVERQKQEWDDFQKRSLPR